ncbi:MAG TPA: methyltransferase domain-containing protein [Verrucomicrobiae bacterium]|nr:methyltransferase domain-containing protein [Verrucomicrobiae bacterium]
MVLAIEVIEPERHEDAEESEKVAHFYDDAEEYAELLASPEVNYGLVKPLQESFASHHVKGGHILDLGCGPGTVAKALPTGFSYTGIDTARSMLVEAVLKGKYKKGYWGRIEDVIPELHQRGEQFDWGVALSSLYYVEEPLPLIWHLAEMCKSGMVLSFDEITQEYKVQAQKEFGVALPLHNHSGLFDDPANIPPGWKVSATWHGHAWHAPRVGLSINAQVVTLVRS